MGGQGVVGHWSSAPFDLGAMESSELVLSADGTGWTAVASVSGSLCVTRLVWHSPEKGVLELHEQFRTDGDWSAEGGGTAFAAARESGPLDTVIRTAYTLDGGTLRLAAPVAFATAYAYVRAPDGPPPDAG